jgi:glucosamine 6-phosphate synthetase-like amidotransferase/phosphosugar isomerase protein
MHLKRDYMSYKIFQKNLSDGNVVPLMYEVKMMNDAFDLYSEIKEQNTSLSTLVLEGFLLHTRVLIDFLEDNRTKFSKDDITCINFVDKNNNKIEGKIVDLKTDIKITLNKHLAHLTQMRLVEKPVWNMTEIKYSINKATQEFIDKCADSNFTNDPSMWRDAFTEQLSR